MANLEIKQYFLTENDCYKKNRKIKPCGIVVHSTAVNNPKLSRYIQPDDGVIGTNKYSNHWNKNGVYKCVHAFIGKDKDGFVRIYQTLPWNHRCWGCGTGKNGSYNDGYIQFEICEDSLKNETYFNETFNRAIELCAYLCNEFDISIDKIVSHKEANALGYATPHGDVDHWLKNFNKDMDWFRDEVNKTIHLLSELNSTESKINTDIKGLKVTTQLLDIYTIPNGSLSIGSYKLNDVIYPTYRSTICGSVWYKTNKGWVSATCVEGWIQESNQKWWYVLDGYKYPTNSWKKIDNKWYYFNSDGWMLASEWVVYNGKEYYLMKDGVMATNAYVKSTCKDLYYWVGEDGAWQPEWNTETPNLTKYKLVD